MSTNVSSVEQQLIVALTEYATEQNKEPCLLTWPAFLHLLQAYCVWRGWDAVFESEDDQSVAIFASDAMVVAAVGDERSNGANSTISDWQLPLFEQTR